MGISHQKSNITKQPMTELDERGDLAVKKAKKITALCLSAAVLVSFCAGCKAQNRQYASAPEYVLTYAENQAEDYPTTQGAYRFAELVYERTGGKIEIQVHANAALGEEQSVVSQMRFGGIDFSRVSLSSLAEFIPKLNVLQMPYLYTGSEHMWKVLEGEIGDDFMNSFDGSSLVPLSWYDAGARNFYNSVRPIERLEDIQGMKIRVQESKLMKDTVIALGAEPVPMAFEDVYSALETGEIDGAENNWPSYESTRHYEVSHYYTIDEHNRVPEMQIISQRTWEKLKPEYQKIIQECARESAEYERELWVKRERSSEEKVRKEGCTLTELLPEEKERFRKAVLPMYEKYCAEYMDIIDAIIAVGR